MKIILGYLLLVNLFFSCNNKTTENSKQLSIKSFTIDGEIKDNDNQIIYLYTLEKNEPEFKDSTRIKNNRFYFIGVVKHPIKAYLDTKDHAIGTSFILANETINIELNDLGNALINSPINNDFEVLRKQSVSIYQQIDYLFPQLQKARMENDYKTLTEIREKIKLIELESNQYFIDYIRENSEKHLSALLLNDLWNTQDKDSIQLQILAKNLSPEIQQTLNFPIQ